MSSAHLTGCDAAAADSALPVAAASRPRLVLAVCILASSLAFVDGSVVNVGLPAIGRSFSANAAGLQWVINGYLLPLSALLLLGGAAGDRFGRRRMLVGGIMVFAMASLGCALAPSLPVLVAGRLAQGVGAAALMPNSLALLGMSFTGEAKGRAIGLWAAFGAIFGAIGPVLGGWLIDLVGWRAIFLVNLPIAAAAIGLALLAVRRDADTRDQPLDWTGGALASLSLGALTWSLTIGSGRAGWSGGALVLGAAGVALGLLFVLAEKRRGDRAMMPLALFRSKSFVGLTLLTLLLYAALGGLLVLVPYVLIDAAGCASARAGAALLPFSVVLAVASPLMGALAGRIGTRLPLSVGPLVVAAGFLLMTRVDAGADYWTEVLPAVLVIALGMSGAVAPLTTAVLAAVDQRHTGAASGFNSAVARTGGLVATALLGTVLAAQGQALVSAFHQALFVGAAAAAAAGACAFTLIAPQLSARSAGGPQH